VSRSFTNISVVAAATMVSRVLGLGRDMLVTAVFATSALASSFYLAFTLPNLFRRLLGEGSLTAALVPTLNEELKRGERAAAFALVNQVASWLLLVAGGVVGLAMLALLQAPAFGAAAAHRGADPDTVQRWLEAAGLGVLLFPYLLCVCLAAAFGAALQTLQRFLEPALSPIWLNISMMALLGGAVYGGWSATMEGRMLWLCAGALLGGVLQMTVPALALMREGWRPRFDLAMSGPMRQIVRLMGPTVFGSAIYLINMAVSRFIGHSLNDSAVTVLNLASRLMELPIGVFAVAVSTVIFPLIARHAAAGDRENLAGSYRKGLRVILVINVPAAAGLMVLATPIIRLLFERGAFTAADTALMQPVLVVFALGLPLFSFVNMVLRAYYAQKDTTTPVRAALLSFAVNVALSLALMRPLGTVGLAVASTAAVLVQAAYLQVYLARKHHGLALHHLAGDLAKVAGAAAVMAGAVAAGWWLWAGIMAPGTLSDAVALALLIPGGIVVYGGLLWVMRIGGREELAALVAQLRARFA
jgi:putative peptidoglycan lipid II flippase